MCGWKAEKNLHNSQKKKEKQKKREKKNRTLFVQEKRHQKEIAKRKMNQNTKKNLKYVFVGDLPLCCTEATLFSLFHHQGIEIVEVKMKGENSSTPFNYAFVELASMEKMDAALALDGTLLFGRNIRVKRGEKKVKNEKSVEELSSVHVKFQGLEVTRKA